MCGFPRILSVFVAISSLEKLHLISGDSSLPTSNQTLDIAVSGWPPTLINVSMNYLPVDGKLQYDVYFNTSCSAICCDSLHCEPRNNIVLNQAVWCQTNTSGNLAGSNSTFHCNICGPYYRDCSFYGISIGDSICVAVKVTTGTGVIYSNATKSYLNTSKMDTLTPKAPKPFAFGYPVPFLVKVSMDTVPLEGSVQYDLYFNRTCALSDDPSSYSTNPSRNLRLLDHCQRVVNQSSCTIKEAFNCTICNTTGDCNSTRITAMSFDICFVLKVTTLSGVRYSARREMNYRDFVVWLPPKNVRLLATAKKELTVFWDSPDGVDNDTLKKTLACKVILQNASGWCKNAHVAIKYADGNIWNRTHTFTGLLPWSRYSVSVCCSDRWLPENPPCVCGDPHSLVAGPFFQHTLPEAPNDPPQVQPCEASCDSLHMNVSLHWQSTPQQKWNGKTTKSIIRIWKVSPPVSTHVKQKEQETPLLIFLVPLEANYSASMLSYVIRNLDNRFTYRVQIQFCTTGGCGPNSTVETLNCETCGSSGETSTLRAPVPTSGESYGVEIGVGVTFFLLLVVVLIVACIIKRTRRTRQQSLEERIGPMYPELYEEPTSPDMTAADGSYDELPLITDPSLGRPEREQSV